MLLQLRHSTPSTSKLAVARSSGVNEARKASAASMIGCTEMPVFRTAYRPGTAFPSVVIPVNGAAMLAWARANCRCRPSGRANGCFAGVEGRFLGLKVAMAAVLLCGVDRVELTTLDLGASQNGRNHLITCG